MSRSTRAPNATPTIGFVATADNLGALARNVTRATDRGFDVLVAVDSSVGEHEVAFIELLAPDRVSLVTVEADVHPFVALSDAASVAESRLLVYQPTESLLDGLDEVPSADRNGSAAGVAPPRPIEPRQSVAEEHPPSELTTSDEPPEQLSLAAIPAYNEANTIDEVVRGVSQYVDEVLVVDDGSTDDTAAVARAAGATVVEHGRNRGYGGALNTAFAQARDCDATTLVTLDADGQHRAADVPALVQCQEQTDAPVVVGSRFVEGATCNAPLYRRFGIGVVNVLTNLSMGVVRRDSWVTDTQSGFRAYDRRAIESLAADDAIGDAMSASTDILHHAHHYNYDIEETPIDVEYDVEDASSINPISHGWTLVSNILQTVERERPMTVLGLPGLFGATVGLMLGYLLLVRFLTSGQLPVGLAVLSVSFTLSGLFACLTGIVLHSLNSLLAPVRDDLDRQ
ncbi:family 2 glycosyl transferase [Haloferax mucosum ATCC BAA-1512]|uniref:Family 2 glycosyl transferase n=1 Tax=Haloferax mucosum ATCC BAA-1512 TaxID=662479 RepID=M0IMK9_9EURY|nr:glycosyltransferase family 2 protein [Haloferax mucosum]ELZ98021.1 family 2 glycosyl transferase [Haloferax mucosum ATCC BAA-1512]